MFLEDYSSVVTCVQVTPKNLIDISLRFFSWNCSNLNVFSKNICAFYI